MTSADINFLLRQRALLELALTKISRTVNHEIDYLQKEQRIRAILQIINDNNLDFPEKEKRIKAL